MIIDTLHQNVESLIELLTNYEKLTIQKKELNQKIIKARTEKNNLKVREYSKAIELLNSQIERTNFFILKILTSNQKLLDQH